MQVIYLLVPLSLLFLLGSIWAIRYAIRHNQFDDLDRAAQRIILEDRELMRQNQHQTPRSSTPTPPHTEE